MFLSEEKFNTFYSNMFLSFPDVKIENCYCYRKFSTKSYGEITGKKLILSTSPYAVIDIDIGNEIEESSKESIRNEIIKNLEDLNVLIVKTSGGGLHIYSLADEKYRKDPYAIRYVNIKNNDNYNIDLFLPIKNSKDLSTGIILPGSFCISSHNKDGDPKEYLIMKDINYKKNLSNLSDILDRFNIMNIAHVKNENMHVNNKRPYSYNSKKNNIQNFSKTIDKITRVNIDMNKKEFINDIILNGFNTSIILHNYASPIESELTILPLLTAFNSWIETTDECDDEITPDDICVITQYLKNPDILTLTDKAKDNFEKIHEEIYDQSENGIPINSGSEKTLLRILEIYNNDYYNEYIKPHLVSNKEDLRFKKVLEILNNNKLIHEIEESILYDIIKTYRNKLLFNDYLSLIENIEGNSSINIIKIISESNVMEEDKIDDFIKKYQKENILNSLLEINKLNRIDIKEKNTIRDISLYDYIKNNKRIDFSALGKDLRKLIAINQIGNVCYIKDVYEDGNSEIYYIKECTKSELKESLNAITYKYKENGKMNSISLGSILMKNLDEFKKYIFIKGISFRTNNKDYLSIFTGFDFQEFVPTDSQLKKINPFFVHIMEVLSDGDKNVNDYILDWLAFIIQNPGEKTKVCNVFIDDGGSGKTLFMEIVALLFGEFGDYNCQKMDSLVGDFNAYEENKIFICCNEVKKQDNFIKNYNSDEFKSLITEKSIVINDKGVSQRRGYNVANFIICSNNKKCITIDENDRRFMVQYSNNKYKNNEEYFNNLKSMKKYENLEIIYNYLRLRDLKNKDLTNFPNTTARTDLINSHLSINERFIINNLDDFLETKFTKNDIKKLYKNFLETETNKIKYELIVFDSIINNNFEPMRVHRKDIDKIFLVLKKNIYDKYKKIRNSMISYLENPENIF